MTAHPDAPRIIQANDVASIVIRQATEHAPGLFVTLDLRYGIADALWAAGYRKDSEVAALTTQLQAAQATIAAAKVRMREIGATDTTVYDTLSRADLSTLAEHDKQVAAKALKDAADDFEAGIEWEELKSRDAEAPKGWTDESINDAIQGSGPIMDWLRARAASIEQAEAE